ncbi:MAG: RNA methyltransferase [Proteobacteria bacterium]|nr:RNA methyltransferase [Pseudomonadota bacterium]
MLNHIRIILCQPTHPGNIGATARAMKNMGLSRLTLVAPENYPHAEATSRASGADDILANAKVVNTFEEAISDCQWLLGTSARSREFPWPQLTPKEAADKAISLSASGQEVGFIFGQERAGLTNEQLQRCDFHLCIPTHPGYSSLNLAAAVQVITYEIYQSFLANNEMELPVTQFAEKATMEEVTGLLAHFETTAIQVGFMDPHHRKKLMPRLKRLFSKAQLEQDEINILRGFLKQVTRIQS